MTASRHWAQYWLGYPAIVTVGAICAMMNLRFGQTLAPHSEFDAWLLSAWRRACGSQLDPARRSGSRCFSPGKAATGGVHSMTVSAGTPCPGVPEESPIAI